MEHWASIGTQVPDTKIIHRKRKQYQRAKLTVIIPIDKIQSQPHIYNYMYLPEWSLQNPEMIKNTKISAK